MALKTPPTNKKHFRNDIEGMRAIAILFVIAAHFAVPGFSAGFIGVDMFFVISGYLITSILVREHESTHTITLTKFYANRLRRLLPALATMIVLSSAIAYILLPASKNIIHSQAGAMSILWVSNIYFSFADVNYFAAENSENLFLHTWSLGVEEQFYLLWPLLIMLALGTFKASKNNSRLFLAFILIGLASFACCLYFIKHNPVIAFYMMPTRAWQFSIGALAWLLCRYKAPNGSLANTFSFSGALLLGLGMLLINEKSVYPSLLAFLPTLGTAMLLWAGSNPNYRDIIQQPFVQKALAVKSMQTIGRLSYSWYLWHWPILIIGEQFFTIKGDPINSLLAISVSLILASITHVLIENPIRFGKPSAILPRWQIISAAIIMVLLSSQSLRWYADSHQQISSETNILYAQSVADVPIIYQHGCDEWYHSAEMTPCFYGRQDAEKTAVLIGDSIVAQWFSVFTHLHDPAVWRIIVLTKSSCPIVDEPFFYSRIGREYTECSEWREEAITWLQEQKVDRLYMGNSALYDFTDTQWTEGTERILKRLESAVHETYFLEASPRLPFHGPDCLLKNPGEQSKSDNCSAPSTNKQYEKVAALLEAVTLKIPNTYWLETSSYVCPNKVCSALQKNSEGNSIVVFRDAIHLTDTFVSLAASHFTQQIDAYRLQVDD